MKVNSVYKTLGEQLHINDLEIRQRKALLDFQIRDEKQLAKVLPFIEQYIPAIINKFYEKQIEIDEVALIIGDADTLERLNRTMNNYVKELFSGIYDIEYTNNRLRIGLIHKRIGVSPKFYLSSLLSLKHHLYSVLDQHIDEFIERENIKKALDKLLMFDCQMVFDAYFRSMLLEVEIARDRAVKNELELETIVADRTRELEELARKDALTGLWNRRHFVEELFCEIIRCKKLSAHLSILYIDLDGFKILNDSQGHQAGDQLLCSFSEKLIELCRRQDTVARMGGDEFVILLPEMDTPQAIQLANQIICWEDNAQYGISMSIGIATAGANQWPDVPEELLGSADAAMYQAKRNGGSQYVVAEYPNDAVIES